MKFVVTTRDPKSDDGLTSYIFSTSDTPTLKQAASMLAGNTSLQKSLVQLLVPYPAGAKKLSPTQALATMLAEQACGREAAILVFSNKLPILPHRPYNVRGDVWFTYDHANNEIACPGGRNQIVPLQPAPAAA